MPWPRLERWLADRTLRRAAPTVSPERIKRALAHASERARLGYQGALAQHAVASGGSFLPDWIRAPRIAAGGEIPERRSTAYPTFGSVGRGRYPGLTNLPKPTPAMLRRFSETPPARRAIDKIKGAITRLEFTVRPLSKQYLDRHGRRVKHLPLDLQGRIEAAERAFQTPDPVTGLSWRTFLGMVVEDILVGGFGAIETRPWVGNALQPFVLYPVPGETICMNLDWQADDSPEPHRAYRYVQTALGGNVSGAVPYTCFRDRELLYLREDPRTHTPFGLGRCEVAYDMINAWLGSMEARERFESNEIPEFMIHAGENATPANIDALRFYWRHNIEGNGEVPIIGGTTEPKILELRARQVGENRNAWPELTLRMIATAFHLAHQTMGVTQDVNRSQGEVAQADEFADAVLPLLNGIEEQVTQHVLYRLLGWHDLRAAFVITEGDREKEVAIARELFDGDIASLNEAREHAGLDPLPAEDPRGQMHAAEFKAWALQQHAPADPFGLQPSARNVLEERATAMPAEPVALPGFERGDAAMPSALDRQLAAFARTIRAELGEDVPDDRFVSLACGDRRLAARIRPELNGAHVH